MHKREHLLKFHCGVCTRQLTDATALFTSCGHFFCLNQQQTCTRLQPHSSGRCDQCGQHCDVGNLANKGANYDSRVQSFVFSDVVKDLQSITEIVEFRNKHFQILGENAAAQQKKISNLTAKYKLQAAENQDLRRENQQLRNQLLRQKQMRQPADNLESLTLPRTYERNPSKGLAVIELDGPARVSALQTGKRRVTPHEGLRINRRTEASARGRTLPEQTYNRSQRTKSINKRRQSQPLRNRSRDVYGASRKDHVSVPHKRSWAERAETQATGGPSKAARKENLSRFGHPTGESRGAIRASYRAQQRFTGDWQQKVSSVPRPSATPEKLRRHGKRSVIDSNSVRKRY